MNVIPRQFLLILISYYIIIQFNVNGQSTIGNTSVSPVSNPILLNPSQLPTNTTRTTGPLLILSGPNGTTTTISIIPVFVTAASTNTSNSITNFRSSSSSISTTAYGTTSATITSTPISSQYFNTSYKLTTKWQHYITFLFLVHFLLILFPIH